MSACSDVFSEPLNVDRQQFVEDPFFDAEVPDAVAEPTQLQGGAMTFTVSRTWNGVDETSFTEALPPILGQEPFIDRVSCSGGDHAHIQGVRRSTDYIVDFMVSYSRADASLRLELTIRNNELVNLDGDPEPLEHVEIFGHCPDAVLTAIGRDTDGFLLP